MHHIEPFYRWRDHYTSEEDVDSPFYGVEYSEFMFDKKIYNYFIHPQWDEFGSNTLYCKILWLDERGSHAVIELIGEWNDALYNDVMFFKREVLDLLMQRGVYHFILIGENVLNFHASDDCYYEEWYEDILDEGGYIAAINFRDHVREEMAQAGIQQYFLMNKDLIEWRTFAPKAFCDLIDQTVTRRIAGA